jgi:hypothetical protein
MTEASETAGANGDFITALDAKLKTLPRSLLLSQVVGPSPAPGQPHAYVPPTAALRSESRQLVHDRALQDIARSRFAFPTEKYRDYKTYVNHPTRTMGVQMPDGNVAYPDIVVVQHPENNARIVAEVETNESVRESVAVYEWGPYADLPRCTFTCPSARAMRR